MPEVSHHSPTLGDCALEIRSKNAGPFWVTMEAFMKDADGYAVVADEGFLNTQVIAELYGVEATQIQIFRIPELNVVKISFPRPVTQACLVDRDVHAGQHHVPLAALPLPTIVTRQQLDRLGQLDTPTVCNALDLIDPDFDLPNFTSKPLRCVHPELPPMVGFARTATIRAVEPPTDEEATAELRADYYEYVAQGPDPTVVVMEDLDGDRAGSGCMWGEVNTTIHQRLGCLGTVTNGSVRDVDDNAPGFQILAGGVVPSRAHAHVVDFGNPVTVHGMTVRHGDLIHADQHGAVVVPAALVDRVLAAADTVTRREQALLTAVRTKSFTIADLQSALRASEEIH